LMSRMRPQMEKFYYNPSKYGSYLDQLGIQYPGGTMAAPPKAQGKTGPAVMN
jgi:aminobenzoyl-glutamate utilization protein B